MPYVDEQLSFLIDTEPEQFNLSDSDWYIKKTDLINGGIEDISSDVTVEEIIDTTIDSYNNAILVDGDYSIGSRNIQYSGDTLNEIKIGHVISISSIVYKIIDLQINGGGNGILRINRGTIMPLVDGDTISRTGNTGVYKFLLSIDTAGKYSVIISSKNTNPIIDFVSDSFEIIEEPDLSPPVIETIVGINSKIL